MRSKKVKAPPPGQGSEADATENTDSNLPSTPEEEIDLQIAAMTPAVAQANNAVATTHALANMAHIVGEEQTMSDMQLHTSTVQSLNSLMTSGHIATDRISTPRR